MQVTSTKVASTPFGDQKAGTSGLRKSTKVFQQAHYVENFIQAYFNALSDEIAKAQTSDVSLVVGGDGRFFGIECVERIIKMSAANPHIKRLIVAQNGLMSTPAVSACIIKYKAFGGIILTASHNPGGPNADFGIKFNCSNGGPALAHLTDKIFVNSTKLDEYHICNDLVVDFSQIGEHTFSVDGGKRQFHVQVIDSVDDYSELMKTIFDFEALKAFFASGVKITVDALNGGI